MIKVKAIASIVDCNNVDIVKHTDRSLSVALTSHTQGYSCRARVGGHEINVKHPQGP